jgi:preprotein translocase subunit YajC
MFLYEIVVDSILHLAILCTILFLIWYFYIRKYQQEQINALMAEFLSSVSKDVVHYMRGLVTSFGQPDVGKTIIENVANTIQNDLTEEAIVVQRDRENIRNSGIIVIVLLWLLVALAFYALWLQDKTKWKEIVTVNVMLFLVLGLMEFGFIKFIATRYVPISESGIRNEVYNQLEVKLKKVIQAAESV